MGREKEGGKEEEGEGERGGRKMDVRIVSEQFSNQSLGMCLPL
jgi:stress-induced morphogen